MQDCLQLVSLFCELCLTGAPELFIQTLHFPRRHIERLFQESAALIPLAVALTDSFKRRPPDIHVCRAALRIEAQALELSLQKWVHRPSQAASDIVVNVIV